jgi:hypothetical protein
MGIANDDLPLHLQAIAFPPHLERFGLQLEWRGRTETVTKLQPQQDKSEDKEQKRKGG